MDISSMEDRRRFKMGLDEGLQRGIVKLFLLRNPPMRLASAGVGVAVFSLGEGSSPTIEHMPLEKWGDWSSVGSGET
jgi:hypothetical protein